MRSFVRYFSILVILFSTRLLAQDVVEIDLKDQNKIVIKKIITLHDSVWVKDFQESVRLFSYGRKPTHKDSMQAASGLGQLLKNDGRKLKKVPGYRSYTYRIERHKPFRYYINEYVVSDIDNIPRFFHWFACYLCNDDNLIELLSNKQSSRNYERTIPISMMVLENVGKGKKISFWMVGDKYQTTNPEPIGGVSDSLNNAIAQLFDQMGKGIEKTYKTTYLKVRVLHDNIEIIGPRSLVKKIKGGVEILVNYQKGDSAVYQGRTPIQLILKGQSQKR